MIVVISGGSSGIGKATATLFAARGHTVYELSRSGADGAGVRHLACDLARPGTVELAIAQVQKAEGRIDLLVVNAGYGISGPFEKTPEAEVRRLYEINVFGAIRLIQAAFPALLAAGRQGGRPRLLLLSSVAGEIAIPFQTHYSASKAVLSRFALALDNEWRPQGIRALALLPGDVRTGFTKNRLRLGDDDPRVSRSVSKMAADEEQGASPDAIAERIYTLLVRKKKPKVLSSYGLLYRTALLLFRLLPVRLANRLIGLLYSR